MRTEFSAGIVPFFESNKKHEYLLLHYEAGHWDFPKGHLEKDETKEEAALRELKEETGLTEVKIIPGFTDEFTYFFKDPQTKELIKKTVYFFVGESKTKEVTLSFEHIGYDWLPYEKAIERLTYNNAKTLLKKIEKLLKE